MEADWSLALGSDDPVIVVPWAAPADGFYSPRFVDLRSGVHPIDNIEEARARPALRFALLRLNSDASRFWTAKCDAWTSSVEAGDAPLDPYEMEALPGQTEFGAGSYIDLLPREEDWLASFDRQERWMRAVTLELREAPTRAARVELVLRRAQVDAVTGFAISWFVEGCGATAEEAAARWSEALMLSLQVIMVSSLP
jgi:hypothetical protein